MSRVILSSVSEEFRGKMTVLLEISDKYPLYSHCYQMIDCPPPPFGPLLLVYTNERRYVFDNTYLRLLVYTINERRYVFDNTYLRLLVYTNKLKYVFKEHIKKI